MTDLKREHFPTGQTFSQKALDKYLEARAQARRDFFTRYILSLAIGVVAGFAALLILPSGLLRIFLAMLCVMVAAMIGTKMTNKSLENLKEQSRNLSVTQKDLRVAKKNLRNGTTAWQEKQENIAE